MICPICNKAELRNFAGYLFCAGCRKMWIEHEFLADILKVGLKYYFTPDLQTGNIVIYDPKEETHNFVEPSTP